MSKSGARKPSSTDEDSAPASPAQPQRTKGMGGRGARTSSNASSSGADEAADQLQQLDVDGEDNGPSINTPKKKKKKKNRRRTSSAAATAIEEDQTPDRQLSEEELDSLAEAASANAPAKTAPASSSSSSAASSSSSSAKPTDPDLLMRTLGGKVIHMHREPWGRWSMTDYAAIKVRSKDYVQSGIKITPPCPPTMEIVHLEIYMCNTQIKHVCQFKDNWLQKYKAANAANASKAKGKSKPAAASSSTSPPPRSSASSPDMSSGEGLRPFDDDFFFVVTFHVQTNPTFHLTMYFQRRDVARANAQKASKCAAKDGGVDLDPQADQEMEEEHEPKAAAAAKQSFDTLFQRFIDGDTAYRNQRLKLIPYVVEGGNWFVTKAVGNRPAIIGKKIDTTYYCNPQMNYMEVDIDVSGSRLGSGIFRVVKGYASYLTLDLTLLIEGQLDDELPEVILGGCRLREVDLSKPEFRQVPKV